ncbi:MAG: four-carbon acid sugar kinase family protein [Treponema sp.]|nr:four-carbon acid sugar kinase family protein [Treponema sp.]
MIVIADDLTGANDTAVQYRKYGVSSIVNVGLSSMQNPEQYSGYELVSINTDSRALSSAEAYKAVHDACVSFCADASVHVYKKIDSVLRGNPGSELEAVMDVMHCSLAFVAPAYPENGRVVHNGILTAASNKIDAVKTIAADMKRAVAAVYLDTIRAGKNVLFTYIQENIKKGVQVFVFDTLCDDDLACIYETVSAFDAPHVLCGSAGLAVHDAKAVAKRVQPAIASTVSSKPGVIFALTASRNVETREQIKQAAKDFATSYIVMDKKHIIAHNADVAVAQCVAAAQEQVRAGARVLIVAVSSLFEDFHMVLKDSETNYNIAFELSVSLGKIAQEVIDTIEVAGIVCFGGDTTMQLCRQMGVFGIEPVTEIAAGTPMGICIGGKLDHLPVVTKSGGFGGASVLTDAIHFLQNYKNAK